MGTALIGWRWAKIAPLDVDATLTDDTAKEDRNEPEYKTAFFIRAQVSETSRTGRRGDSGSVPERTKSILIRVADAAKASWEPADGDKLLGIYDRHYEAVDETVLYLKDPRRAASGPMADAFWRASLVDEMPVKRDW